MTPEKRKMHEKILEGYRRHEPHREMPPAEKIDDARPKLEPEDE